MAKRGRPRSILSKFDKDTAVALVVMKEEQDKNRANINAIIQILKEHEDLLLIMSKKVQQLTKIIQKQKCNKE